MTHKKNNTSLNSSAIVAVPIAGAPLSPETGGAEKTVNKAPSSDDVGDSPQHHGCDGGRFSADYTKIVELWLQAGVLTELRHRASEKNDPACQWGLGVMYRDGNGVPQDLIEAVAWLEVAAAQGHIDAQCCLGELLEAGEGTRKDCALAEAWYRRAALRGHIQAQYCLGSLLSRGDGVQTEHAEAVKWLTLAAEKNHAGAQCCLGNMYDWGHGVAADRATALKWYRRSANQGNLEAMTTIRMIMNEKDVFNPPAGA